ncbi:MAG: calcium-binding protein [Solirubrobacterales bacterium]|jgi:Ca2+-binding RTX toxin-like protein|nr:calcium-binding protein [Solirubrobacterales bacterium]
MWMARRRLITLLVLLAVPATAHAELAVTVPPVDLAPELAIPTVDGLAVAPALPAIPAVKRHVRYGSPGVNRMQARGARGVVFHGLEGADRLKGGSGSDQLFGETAPDWLFGRAGADLLDGGSGGDSLWGGGGADRVFGGWGMDDLHGGPGNDVLDSGPALDKVHGDGGDDLIHGGSGHDKLWGGAGDDVIYPDMHGDEVWAGPGDDIVYGNNGSALGPIDCGPGDDTLVVNPVGEDGGYSARNRIRSGGVDGCEHIVYAHSPVDPTIGIRYTAPESGGVKTGTERDDHLNGGHGSDKLYGLGGDDDFWADQNADGGGYDAHDLIDGGAGNDVIYGGRGFNRLLGGPGNDFVQGGSAGNVLLGGSGDDEIRTRGSGTNRIRAGAGDDTIYATATQARVTIDCGPGRDTVYYGMRKPSASHCERFVDQFSRN